MTDPILPGNERKAALSHAYVAALAASHGYSIQPGPNPDVDSVDVTLRSGSSRRDTIDLQLKATATPGRRHEEFYFRLKHKNYNDLTMPRAVPLFLVVIELPADESQWVACTPEHLVIRRCGWWLSLAGRKPMDAGSRTVVIPSHQRIGGSGLAPLFAYVRGTPS